jgi:nucleotide-binding universal stress UspA family protein
MPMIKTVLVAAAGTDSDAAAFAAALAIARLFAAHLDVLHIRPDPAGLALAMATDVGSGALTAGLLDRLEQDAHERETKARGNFERFCAEAVVTLAAAPSRETSAAPSAEWHVEIGEEPRWIARYGLAADLIVAARAADVEGPGQATLAAALVETGRPLLIPAAAPPARLERIAIGWKPTVQAARAVALAMPLLARAKEVAVLAVDEQAGAAEEAGRLVRSLAWHGLAAAVERLPPGPEGVAATLLAAARARADLLVMGGYGHSRVREWVFGGVTQAVLTAAPLPVLIAH